MEKEKNIKLASKNLPYSEVYLQMAYHIYSNIFEKQTIIFYEESLIISYTYSDKALINLPYR